MPFGVDDAILVAAAAQAAGSIWGQSSANSVNRDVANKQMAWQEMMSNTSWQRSVADMKKAGINPMLAVSKGGATTPPGAAIPSQSVTKDVGNLPTSALQAAITKAQLSNLAADTQNKAASAYKTKIDADNASRLAPFNKAAGQAASWVVDKAPGLISSSARSVANFAREHLHSPFSSGFSRSFVHLR